MLGNGMMHKKFGGEICEVFFCCLFLIYRVPRDRVHSFKLDIRREFRALWKEIEVWARVEEG